MTRQELMPVKGKYTAILVLSFLLGIIWGVLSIRPYMDMTKAINENNLSEAWDNAHQIKNYCLIGVGVNLMLLVFAPLFLTSIS